MATTTYINGNMETLATAMQQLVTIGYFDSIEYDSENSAVICYDADENAVLTLAKGSVNLNASIRFDDGTTKSAGVGGANANNAAYPYYLYVCSGGAYLSFSGTYGTNSGMIISKTNNEKVGIVVIYATGNASSRVTTVHSLATDDDATQINTTFAFGLPTTRNQTTLMNIPTCGAPNVVSYFPDVYYTFTSQYNFTNNATTPPQNFTQDGKRYLWIGYYAIRDEEAAS